MSLLPDPGNNICRRDIFHNQLAAVVVAEVFCHAVPKTDGGRKRIGMDILEHTEHAPRHQKEIEIFNKLILNLPGQHGYG